MNEANRLAKLSAQLADPARASIVLDLMDGNLRPTGELQISANISPSSASTHLSKLVSARILTVVKRGRLKYYRIATAAVAQAVEAMSIVALPGTAVQNAARSSLNPFAFARTCFDHLAGKLGVEIARALEGQNVIRANGKCYELTACGWAWMAEMGIKCEELQLRNRSFAAQCLDFTERRHHLAGALGAALLERMVELDWIVKSRVPRAVRLTAKGRLEVTRRLCLKFTDNRTVKYESN
jgi:DNA-binding transcriptional ArsR family regulator